MPYPTYDKLKFDFAGQRRYEVQEHPRQGQDEPTLTGYYVSIDYHGNPEYRGFVARTGHNHPEGVSDGHEVRYPVDERGRPIKIQIVESREVIDGRTVRKMGPSTLDDTARKVFGGQLPGDNGRPVVDLRPVASQLRAEKGFPPLGDGLSL